MTRLIETLPIEEKKEKVIIHKKCGAKIGYNDEDIKSDVFNYECTLYFIPYIKCPNCGKKVEL